MPVDLSPKKADESISYEEIMYELHVLQKIERGLKDVEEGRTTSHENVKQEFKKWLS